MSSKFQAINRDIPYPFPPSVQDWLPEKADVEDGPEMDIPEELARREDRLAAIKKPREVIERGVESGLHGLESAADVRFEGLREG